MKYIFILISLTLFFECLEAQDTDTIQYSHLNINNDNDYSSFEMLDGKLNDYRFIFIGENHLYRKINDEINLKFLKYLHEKAGVNTLALEFGFTRGYLLNKYIHTGDTLAYSLLEKETGKTFLTLYKNLYRYNQSLPDEDKINVVGIDVERFLDLAVRQLNLLLPENKEIPGEIKIDIESLRGLAGYIEKNKLQFISNNTFSAYSSEKTMGHFLENYELYDTIYKEYLGENADLFIRITESLKGHIKWKEYCNENSTHCYVYRENYMEEQVMAYLKNHPDAKFFAQFGRCHVSVTEQEEACNWYNYNSIATRLNNSKYTELNKKVCSIAMFYTRSASFSSNRKESKDLKKLDILSGNYDLTLFNLRDSSQFESELPVKYNYAIINNVPMNKSFEDNIDHSLVMFFSAALSNHIFHFTDLNSFFPNKGYTNEKQSFTIEIGFLENFSGIRKISIQLLQADTLQYNDSITTTLSGGSFMVYIGGDLTKSKFIDLIPQFGYGFGQLKLSSTNDLESNSTTVSPFKDPVLYTYKNPALLLDFQFDLRFNISRLSFGGRTGIQLDISNKNWRRNGTIVDSSPTTSLYNFYYGGFISVNLF